MNAVHQSDVVLSQNRCGESIASSRSIPSDHKQSAVMAALAIAQDEHGWLSPEVMQTVADYLGMPPIAV